MKNSGRLWLSVVVCCVGVLMPVSMARAADIKLKSSSGTIKTGSTLTMEKGEHIKFALSITLDWDTVCYDYENNGSVDNCYTTASEGIHACDDDYPTSKAAKLASSNPGWFGTTQNLETTWAPIWSTIYPSVGTHKIKAWWYDCDYKWYSMSPGSGTESYIVKPDCPTPCSPQNGKDCKDYNTRKQCKQDSKGCWVWMDYDCSGSQVCFEGDCISKGHGDYCEAKDDWKIDCKYEEFDCDSSSECQSPYHCVGEFKLQPCGASECGCCKTDEIWDLGDNSCVECTWDTDCDGQKDYCVAGKCVECEKDKHCDDDYEEEGDPYCPDDDSVVQKITYHDFSCSGNHTCDHDESSSLVTLSVDGEGDFCDDAEKYCGGCKHGKSDCDQLWSECDEGLDLQCTCGTLSNTLCGCCLASETWDSGLKKCVECIKDSNCDDDAKPVCWGNACVECNEDSDCTQEPYEEEGAPYCPDDNTVKKDITTHKWACQGHVCIEKETVVPELVNENTKGGFCADVTKYCDGCAHGKYDCDEWFAEDDDECAGLLVCKCGSFGDCGCCEPGEKWNDDDHKCEVDCSEPCPSVGVTICDDDEVLLACEDKGICKGWTATECGDDYVCENNACKFWPDEVVGKIVGTAYYTDAVYNGNGPQDVQQLPIRAATAQLVFADGTVIGSTEVELGDDGSFEVPFAGIPPGSLIAVSIQSRNQVVVVDAPPDVLLEWPNQEDKPSYSFEGQLIDVNTGGEFQTEIVVPGCPQQDGCFDDSVPFNLFDTALHGYEYAIAKDTGDNDLGKVDIFWPDQVAQLSYSMGDIRVPAKFEEAEGLLLHEYGHHVLNAWQGSDFAIMLKDHGPCMEMAPLIGDGAELAWNEGFASYFAAAVQRANLNTSSSLEAPWELFNPSTNNKNHFDLEDPGCQTLGQKDEGSVAAILWDIHDSLAIGEPHDTYNDPDGKDRIANLASNGMSYWNPTICEFLRAWTTYGWNAKDLVPIFEYHGVNPAECCEANKEWDVAQNKCVIPCLPDCTGKTGPCIGADTYPTCNKATDICWEWTYLPCAEGEVCHDGKCLEDGHDDFCKGMEYWYGGCKHKQSDCDNDLIGGDSDCAPGLVCWEAGINVTDSCCHPWEEFENGQCTFPAFPMIESSELPIQALGMRITGYWALFSEEAGILIELDGPQPPYQIGQTYEFALHFSLLGQHDLEIDNPVLTDCGYIEPTKLYGSGGHWVSISLPKDSAVLESFVVQAEGMTNLDLIKFAAHLVLGVGKGSLVSVVEEAVKGLVVALAEEIGEELAGEEFDVELSATASEDSIYTEVHTDFAPEEWINGWTGGPTAQITFSVQFQKPGISPIGVVAALHAHTDGQIGTDWLGDCGNLMALNPLPGPAQHLRQFTFLAEVEYTPGCENALLDEGEECEAFDTTACKSYQDCIECKCVGEPEPDCGNKVKEAGEECEFPSHCGWNEACSKCKCVEIPPACDDEKLDPGEECDKPFVSACKDYEDCVNCACDGVPPADCGNGKVEAGEQCEVPADCGAGQTCDEISCNCVELPAECDNGVLDVGEECDLPYKSSCAYYQTCDNCTCTGNPPPDCNDGIIEGNEQCDSGVGCDGGLVCSKCKCIVPPPFCGNDKLDLGEECDLPETEDCEDYQVCEGCKCVGDPPPECKNLIIEGDEECEIAEHCQAGFKCEECLCEYVPPVCGDDVIGDGEDCDGELTAACAWYETCENCQCEGEAPPICGNGKIEIEEECDDGPDNSDTVKDACRTNCKAAHCSDGVEDTPEDCDDGNLIDGDKCSSDCKDENVKVGSIIFTEFMADPEKVSDANGEWFEIYNTEKFSIPLAGWTMKATGTGDSITILTDSDLSIGPKEYLVFAGNDDIQTNGGVVVDFAYPNFNLPNAGEEVSIRKPTSLEAIDVVAYSKEDFPEHKAHSISLHPQFLDGQLNDDAANWCLSTTALNSVDTGTPGQPNDPCYGYCGDGDIDPDAGEECDDGPDNSDVIPDACRTDCQKPWCGDSVVDSNEECDDGPDNSDDLPNHCRTDCQKPWCGDGIKDLGEECDNGAQNSDTTPDACRKDCTQPECGDGVIDTNEECDDGNTENGDGCDQDCAKEIVPECGNGTCGDDEDCITCPEDCEPCPPVCGNGITEPGEQCDDGNDDPDDGCLPDCTVPGDIGPGDIIITEIMANPEAVSDSLGEWFEIRNMTEELIELAGWQIKDGDTDIHEIDQDSPLTIEPGQYLVLGKSTEKAENGGATVHYAYGADMNLGNSGDEIIILPFKNAPWEFDQVWYDPDSFPVEKGRSMMLDAIGFDHLLNDDGGNWCLAPDSDLIVADGDYGTPGEENSPCSGAECGNGFVDQGEECDDGNKQAGDGCSADCTIEEVVGTCGDGNQDPNEECDDGNNESLDGCSAKCEKEILEEGDIIITELMIDCEGISDNVGEWFEVYNTTTWPINLKGWTIADKAEGVSSYYEIIEQDLVVQPGGLAVLAKSGNPDENGGFEPDYVYSSVVLKDAAHALYLKGTGESFEGIVDGVSYEQATPGYEGSPSYVKGFSRSLNSTKFNHVDNDSPANWCPASAENVLPDGQNHGTPGKANAGCGGSVCGNGTVEAGEECDIGLPETDCCNPVTCQWETGCCPNGSCEAGENCDICPEDCDDCCQPDCTGKCGQDDGCDGVCECPDGKECCPDGTCQEECLCEPDCDGKECGDDGCGGECGECTGCGDECVAGQCEFTSCDGKDCGDDGCGGLCGVCKANQECQAGTCECEFETCGELCCGQGQSCCEGDVCLDDCNCIADCNGKDCGPDGCGGSCGMCGTNQVCTIDAVCLNIPSQDVQVTTDTIHLPETSGPEPALAEPEGSGGGSSGGCSSRGEAGPAGALALLLSLLLLAVRPWRRRESENS